MRNLLLLLLLVLPYSMFSQVSQCSESRKLFQSANTQKSAVVTDYSVTNYEIHIDTIALIGHQIRAYTGVTMVASTASFTDAELMLLGFTIDSVTAPGYTVNFTYNDTVIDMQISPQVVLGDSLTVWIYYNGEPAQDLSGWGGFYFSGSYAFNLGVGFQADPHNYGRAWFPCVDDFISRSTYNFYITTDSASKAFCNGTLQSSVVNPNGTITWNWKQNQTIPSYLASMAVAPYYTLTTVSNGIPVEWACMPFDTNSVNATFSNLDTTLSAFIDAYGPYPFDKVGYCLVPFNAGAMEHASSIHIGRVFVNGSQTYATLWAHELSHMWWGDKVTCETAEDMWLNEGFASYNEAFYTFNVSGIEAYRDWIRSNHRRVLQFAHTPAQDGSYLTMNNIPHQYTYGMHVYQKGANLVHTMKNYMGEQEFKSGCQAYMSNRAYNHASSYDLRDELTAGSGVDMTRFFDDWIFTPGFPHFSIDSVVYVPGGLDHYYVYTRQRTKGNNNHLYEMPIEVNFTDGLTDTSVIVVIDSLTNVFHIPLFYAPTKVMLDRYGKVCDARVSNEGLIFSPGNKIIAETGVTVNVSSAGTDTSWVRVEHNFVAPDPFISSNPGIRLSDNRYWLVDGIFKPGFDAGLTFTYDGSISGSTGYLDNTLITGTEDSLVILYRQGAGFDWNVISNFTINTGVNLNDKRGTISIDSVITGEYTLGYYDYTVGLPESAVSDGKIFTVHPNPSSHSFTFRIAEATNEKVVLTVTDLGGRIVFVHNFEPDESEFCWETSGIASGVYAAFLTNEKKLLDNLKIIKH